MKLLFLDIDGVLNHSQSPDWERGSYYVLDDLCIENLQRILDETGVSIVLSSTWRFDPEAMAALSLKINRKYIIGRTPAIRINGPRKIEILGWLKDILPYSYGWEDRSTIDAMAVLDDDTDADLGDDSFFKTNFDHGGLTGEIAARVIEHLWKV